LAHDWLVTINPSKTEAVIFSTKRYKPVHPALYYENNQINIVNSHNHLGVTLSSNMSWRTHILNINDKASK
jgi:hypothetical protein